MKETRCDYCGKIINGYYPDREIMKPNMYYCCSVKIPGGKRDDVTYKLEIDLFNNRDPITFKFCSLDCLAKKLKSIEQLIEDIED